LEELGQRDKSKGKTINSKLCLIDWMILNRLWPFIFIGREGLAPLGVETLTKSCRNTTPNRFWQDGAV
jgi:hypothetical protein